MRAVNATFLAMMGLTIMLAYPATARPSTAPIASEEVSKPPCYGYEQNPDGSWRQIPCQENGVSLHAGAKVTARDAGKASR